MVFDATTLPGLWAWLDFSDASTITADVNGNVSQVVSKDSTNRVFTKKGSTVITGSGDWLSFASQGRLGTDNSTYTSSKTLKGSVMMKLRDTFGLSFRAFFDTGTQGSLNFAGFESNTTGFEIGGLASANQTELWGNILGADDNELIRRSPTLPEGSFTDFIFSIDPDNAEIFIGIDEKKATIPLTATPDSFGSQRPEMTVASSYNGFAWWEGDIAQVIVTEDLITEAQYDAFRAGVTPGPELPPDQSPFLEDDYGIITIPPIEEFVQFPQQAQPPIILSRRGPLSLRTRGKTPPFSTPAKRTFNNKNGTFFVAVSGSE